MASKGGKKAQSVNRSGSANKADAASIAASLGVQDAKKRGVVIWPEWSDGDINAEKWESAPHKGKDKGEKGKSPVAQHLFEDPEGKIEFPPGYFKVSSWKRPQDYITDRTPVIVDTEGQLNFDLMTANEHIHNSELMRWITSQITALWQHSHIKPDARGEAGSSAQQSTADPGAGLGEGEQTHSWRPWEHIYAINKILKGPNMPAYNPHGKYVVKLYWMGCWRKVIVDDQLPFDEADQLLLPATARQYELWPMLLTKALVKVASLDYNGGSQSCEFGEFSVIHSLTGWLPETIPLQYGHLPEVWQLLKTCLPEFKLPEIVPEVATDPEKKSEEIPQADSSKDDLRVEKDKSTSTLAEKSDSKTKDLKKEGKEKEKGKDGKEDKKDKKDKGDKDKDKFKEKSAVQDEVLIPDHPEMVVFASFSSPPKYPVRISVLGEMADASERLRQSGISHIYPHPLLLTQTRSCPLEPPPPPEVVPAWKLIRPRNKKPMPSDEPIIVEEEKPIQCVSITSPFVNYNVSPLPIPTDVHRPRSVLERGSARVLSRPGTANASIIDETDESKPPPDTPPPEEVEPPKPPTPEPKLEEVHERVDGAPRGSVEEDDPQVSVDGALRGSVEEDDPQASVDGALRGSVEEDDPQVSVDGALRGSVEEDDPQASVDGALRGSVEEDDPQASLDGGLRGSGEADDPQVSVHGAPRESVEEDDPRSLVNTPNSIISSVTQCQVKRLDARSVSSAEDLPRESLSSGLSHCGSDEVFQQPEAAKACSAKPRKKVSGSASKQKASSDGSELSTVIGSPKPSSEKKIRKGSSVSTSRTQSAKIKDSKSDTSKSSDTKVGGVVPQASQSLESSAQLSGEGEERGEEQSSDNDLIGGEETNEKPEEVTKSQEVWMDFETFCTCFKTLYIFHKPNTYLCNHKHSDLKTAQPVATTAKDKKSAPSTAVSSVDDKAPHFLFVDNLKPTEIVVSFSGLCRWNEPAPTPAKEDSKGHGKGKEKASDKDSKADAVTVDSLSLHDSGANEPAVPEPINPGLLVAEPYSWKSLVIGQPILRLRSTATRAAVLSLPEGRHVLRFNMSALHGYHIHLCSTVNFVFGDEEKVMAELTKESCRFVDNAHQIITALGKCITNFHDPLVLPKAMDDLYTTHCPYRTDRLSSKQHHHQLFLSSFYSTMKRSLAESQLLTADMAFAWRVFFFDSTTVNPLSLHYSPQSRPATGVTTSDRGSAAGKKAPGATTPGKKQAAPPPEITEPPVDSKVDQWKNREITPEEHVAAIKLQRGWRGYYVRKIKSARTPGMELNLKIQEQLQRAFTVLEPQAENTGLQLLRHMFKADPELMSKYPFYKDEWNKISYADYQGGHPEQPSGAWFIMFREVFHVSEEMLCVPKLYVPLHTCMLRVINNDNGEEVPRVFQKVSPHVYRKNKRGYTFLAEARTTDQSLMAGRWRMRLIGSLSPLPAPAKNEVNSSFHTRELRDYYVPNDNNIILRYSVRVQEDHLVSLQLSTSKSDVYAKLQVLDGDQVLHTAMGKGHVVLPAAIFLKHQNPDEQDPKRPGSRSSIKGRPQRGSVSRDNSKKRTSSAHSSVHSRHSTTSGDDEDDEVKPHKYVIQATVLRNSWPLSESQWTFVQMLKEMEKNETKVTHKERVQSPVRSDKAPAATKGKEKATKGKGGKEKPSPPPVHQFDISKPNWTLRVVSDASAADEIEVKKDVERLEEIRAMKRAWEEAEPGRAAKAQQSRLNYLNSHLIKVRTDDEPASSEEAPVEETASSPPPSVTQETQDTEVTLTLQPPPPPPPKEVLQPVDYTPFLRKTQERPRLRDEAEIERQLEERAEEIARYRASREEVERCRELDRQRRNQAKILQLAMCEKMQAAVDAAREAVNVPREAFRQKFLEGERIRLEAIANQEAALKTELEKTSPAPKGKKSPKGKTTPSGKKKK